MVWTMAFVYVGEIYPTLWRSTGSGLASGAARIGSMIAPQLVFTNPSLRNVFNNFFIILIVRLNFKVKKLIEN